MGIKDLFKFRKWQPDLNRSPPSKKDYPDHVLTLNDDKFNGFIDKYPISVVDFWAPWCGPCKTLTPRVRELSKKYKGKVAFGKINIDKYKEFAKRFHVIGIPNLIFFSYGEKVTNLVGVRSTGEIQDKIEEILTRFEK